MRSIVFALSEGATSGATGDSYLLLEFRRWVTVTGFLS